ncbi:MAG: nucleotide sugar dehydrogenase [Thaumarchaeota archaeon]|nr:nucleotide sugar dehydrogenase [Nitrososphaerota archaeon]
MRAPHTLLSFSPSRVPSLLRQGKMTIAVVGLGRIGLPTAAILSKAGALVLGADINEEVVSSVNRGRCKFVDEPGLPQMVRDQVKAGRLQATTDVRRAVSRSDISIISVPTPVDDRKTPDYTAVKAASATIGHSLRKGSVVVVESTVGPGTVENLIQPILEAESGLKAGKDFGLASAPERSDPGNILGNMATVPRVVGATDPRTLRIISALYRTALGVNVIQARNPKTANAIKLTENLFRDVNIAFANEFSLLFEKLGIDAIEVINGCATKYNFLPHYPGAGVGGPCLTSNSYYLISEGVRAGNIPYLIRMAREINDRMPDHVVELVSEALNEVGKTVRGSRIALLGVAYKPNIKDVQLTPAEEIFKRITEMGGEISIHDPMYEGEMVFGTKVKSIDGAVVGADCVIIATGHKEFKSLNLQILAKQMRSRVLVDGRNLVDPGDAIRAGFAYRGVGRGR